MTTTQKDIINMIQSELNTAYIDTLLDDSLGFGALDDCTIDYSDNPFEEVN